MTSLRAQSGRPALGDFSTLPAALDYAASQPGKGVRFFSALGDVECTLSYAALQARACQIARHLAGIGLKRGSAIGLLAETKSSFLELFYGCQYAGLLPCPLPVRIQAGGRRSFITSTRLFAQVADMSFVLVSGAFENLVIEAVEGTSTRVMTVDALAQLSPAAETEPFASGEPAYIQFSSGSTAHPKGVLATQASVSANARGLLRHGIQLTPDDRAFSWLPFYHDMGLVGFSIAPLYGQCCVDYLSPSAFVRRPALWPRLMSDCGSTITYAPSFGYQLVAERLQHDESNIDLRSLRIAGVGGDVVRADVLARFAQRMKRTGFRESAFMPSYGMAEMTLAITFSDAGLGAVVDEAGPHTDSATAAGRMRNPVVCGRPLPDHELLITSADGSPLPDRHVGHILVRGPSLAQAYVGEASLDVNDEGYLRTGDMGYLADGRLVITGRSKDLILYHGRNIWPEDLEQIAMQIASLKHGDVAAFAVEVDSDPNDVPVVLVQLRGVPLVQLRGVPDEADALCLRIARAIAEAMGILCRVVPVPAKTIPLTSSGKIARALARARYLEDLQGDPRQRGASTTEVS